MKADNKYQRIRKLQRRGLQKFKIIAEAPYRELVL